MVSLSKVLSKYQITLPKRRRGNTSKKALLTSCVANARKSKVPFCFCAEGALVQPDPTRVNRNNL